MDVDAIELWEVVGLRCLLYSVADHWTVSLIREHQVVKSDVFIDGASAIAAADEWRAVVDDEINAD